MKSKSIVSDPLRATGNVSFYNGDSVSQSSTMQTPQSSSLAAAYTSSSANYHGYSDKQHTASSSPMVVLSNGANQPIVRNTSHLKAETHISFVRPSLSSPAKSIPHYSQQSTVESDATTDLSNPSSNSNPIRTNGLMLFYNPTSLTTPTNTTGTTHTSLATTTSTASNSKEPTATAHSKIKLKSLSKSKSETAMMRDDSKRKLSAHKGRDQAKHTVNSLRTNNKAGGKQSTMMFVQA
jgi:hypothetical protein